MLEGAKIALCISQNKLDNAVVLEVENFKVQQYKEGGGNPWCG